MTDPSAHLCGRMTKMLGGAIALGLLVHPDASAAQAEQVSVAEVMARSRAVTAVTDQACPEADMGEIVVCGRSRKRDFRVGPTERQAGDRVLGDLSSRTDLVGSSALCSSHYGAAQGAGCGRGLDIMKMLGASR